MLSSSRLSQFSLLIGNLQYGRTALILASMHGHLAIVEALLAEEQINADVLDRVSTRTFVAVRIDPYWQHGLSALMHAAQADRTAVVLAFIGQQ